MSRLAIELYNCLDQEINEPDPVRYWGISTSRGGKKWRKEIANFSDIKSILDSSMNESTITLKCQMIIIPKHGCFMMFGCVLQVTKWAETNPRWCDTTRNVRENQINHFMGRTQQTHTHAETFGYVFKFRDFWDKSLLIIIFNKHKSF